MLIDTHCHLDRIDLTPYDNDLGAALAAAKACGVERAICIGIDQHNAAAVKAIAEQFEGVYATVGAHPLDIDSEALLDADALHALADHPRVVAMGETGLDYYYSQEHKALQQESFARHLVVAGERKLPVVVHTRDAREDTLALIRSHGNLESAGVLHCFTEDWAMARAALDMNYYISISGIVTFRNGENVREVARQVPLDRLLIETDAPYLAPIPHRGKRNEPKYLADVARFVADLRGLSLEEFGRITTENAERLFRLPAQHA